MSIAKQVCALLSDACDLFVVCEKAGDGFDYSYIWRPSISDHEQNSDFQSCAFLVSLVRDSTLLLANRSPQQAKAVTNQWIESRIPLLRRILLLMGASTALYSADEVIGFLLEPEPPWLWMHTVQREAFQVLGNIWPKLRSKRVAAQLLRAIMKGPPRAMFRTDTTDETFTELTDEMVAERLNILNCTSRSLPKYAAQRLAALRPEGATPVPPERAGFPTWSSASWGDPTLRYFDPEFDIRKLPPDQQASTLATLKLESPYWTTWRLMVHEDVDAASALLS